MSSVDEVIIDEEIQEKAAPEQEAQAQVQMFDFDMIKKIFLTEASPEPIEKFQDSPLCFDRSEGLAQMLKALAGWLGANLFNLAIIHLIVGFMKWVRQKRESAA